jgi:hypothetical protein
MPGTVKLLPFKRTIVAALTLTIGCSARATEATYPPTQTTPTSATGMKPVNEKAVTRPPLPESSSTFGRHKRLRR